MRPFRPPSVLLLFAAASIAIAIPAPKCRFPGCLRQIWGGRETEPISNRLQRHQAGTSQLTTNHSVQWQHGANAEDQIPTNAQNEAHSDAESSGSSSSSSEIPAEQIRTRIGDELWQRISLLLPSDNEEGMEPPRERVAFSGRWPVHRPGDVIQLDHSGPLSGSSVSSTPRSRPPRRFVPRPPVHQGGPGTRGRSSFEHGETSQARRPSDASHSSLGYSHDSEGEPRRFSDARLSTATSLGSTPQARLSSASPSTFNRESPNSGWHDTPRRPTEEQLETYRKNGWSHHLTQISGASGEVDTMTPSSSRGAVFDERTLKSPASPLRPEPDTTPANAERAGGSPSPRPPGTPARSQRQLQELIDLYERNGWAGTLRMTPQSSDAAADNSRSTTLRHAHSMTSHEQPQRPVSQATLQEHVQRDRTDLLRARPGTSNADISRGKESVSAGSASSDPSNLRKGLKADLQKGTENKGKQPTGKHANSGTRQDAVLRMDPGSDLLQTQQRAPSPLVGAYPLPAPPQHRRDRTRLPPRPQSSTLRPVHASLSSSLTPLDRQRPLSQTRPRPLPLPQEAARRHEEEARRARRFPLFGPSSGKGSERRLS